MHSYILNRFIPQNAVNQINTITGFNLTLKQYLNHIDIVNLYPESNLKTVAQKKSIKIESIRNFQKTLSQQPRLLPLTLGIIWEAEFLTQAAQQALLKLLEEPGQATQVYVVTNNYHLLLPTIQSRCQIIHNPSPNSEVKTETKATDVLMLKDLTIGERLVYSEQYSKNREQALTWLNQVIAVIRTELQHHPTKENKTIIKNAIQAYQDIENNVNLKLALDNLMIAWNTDPPQLD